MQFVDTILHLRQGGLRTEARYGREDCNSWRSSHLPAGRMRKRRGLTSRARLGSQRYLLEVYGIDSPSVKVCKTLSDLLRTRRVDFSGILGLVGIKALE